MLKWKRSLLDVNVLKIELPNTALRIRVRREPAAEGRHEDVDQVALARAEVGDRIGSVRRCHEHEVVGAAAARQRIRPGAADQPIAAGPAGDAVVPGVAYQQVGAVAAVDGVAAVAAEYQIVAGVAGQRLGRRGAGQDGVDAGRRGPGLLSSVLIV